MVLKLALLSIVVLLSLVSAHAQNRGIGFGYEGSIGPQRWGSLNRSYTKCSAGKLQSPINIRPRIALFNRGLGSLLRDYHPADSILGSHVCNMAIDFGEGAGSMVVDNKTYMLKQMHWHTPSEHLINGVQYAAELHMVHQAQDGNYSVVSTLFDFGEADPFLSMIMEQLKKLREDKLKGNITAKVDLGEVNPMHIEPNAPKYFRYIGSLTTPPCSENVPWTILAKVKSISKEQVELLEAPLDVSYHHNSRPVQPLNGRHVQMFHDLDCENSRP